MKQLELELKERLLIVEYPSIILADGFGKLSEFSQKYELLCKGSELTEEIADGLVHQSIYTLLFAHYVKDIPVNTYCYKSALESFKSAIEAQNYYWGENPLGEDPEKNKLLGTRIMNMLEYGKWKDAESRTFNPEKTLIFKIV